MSSSRRLKAAADQPGPPATGVRATFDASVAAMPHLTAADAALVELGRSFADQIDAARERVDLAEQVMRDAAGDPGIFRRLQKLEAMCDQAKTVGWLGPQLRRVLADLAGTPAGRSAAPVARPAGGRLAELRAGVVKSTAPRGADQSPGA